MSHLPTHAVTGRRISRELAAHDVGEGGRDEDNVGRHPRTTTRRPDAAYVRVGDGRCVLSVLNARGRAGNVRVGGGIRTALNTVNVLENLLDILEGEQNASGACRDGEGESEVDVEVVEVEVGQGRRWREGGSAPRYSCCEHRVE